MSIFILECEAVTEVGSSLSSLVSQISDISSSVSGYDTSCEDGFDFSSAKSAIASNIEACSNKVRNTAQLLENVVSSHTALQGSLKFGENDGTNSSVVPNSGGSSASSGKADSEHSTPRSNRTVSRSSGGSGGGGSASSYVSSSISSPMVGGVTSNMSSTVISTPSVNESVTGTVAPAVAATVVLGLDDDKDTFDEDTVDKTTTSDNKDDDKSPSEEGEKKNTEDSIKRTIIEKVNSVKVDDATREIFDGISYDDSGYGIINNKHIISCDSSYGKVGDMITIKKADGTKIECVIGNVVDDKNTISFYVNDTEISVSESIGSITQSNVEIINNGQMNSTTTVGKRVLSNDRVIEVLGEESESV